MENQAYEEEQSRAEEERSTFESRCRDRQFRVSVTLNGDPFRVATTTTTATTHLENHVYEDISADARPENHTSERFAERRISRPAEARRTCEDRRSPIADSTARQAWIGESSSSSSSPAIDRPFRGGRGLNDTPTLTASSADISANRDSAPFGTSDDDPDEAFAGNRDPRDPSAYHDPPRTQESASPPSPRENEEPARDSTGSAERSSDRRPNRRRRKKDCKHCRSKLAGGDSRERLDDGLAGGKNAILLRENASDRRRRDAVETQSDASGFLFRQSLLRSQNIKIYPIVSGAGLQPRDNNIGAKSGSPSAAFPACPYASGPRSMEERAVSGAPASDKTEQHDGRTTGSDRRETPEALADGADMRINSIYSRDRWYGKESPIFYTDVKDPNPFQRAYSLPTRTYTPTSQNRVNLRRSVRNDPPPHPARLDKHRRGWTLHLARPLKKSGCSSPLVPLLIVVLILLGVAGVALYIVFEPEKLQIIQQYLKSSTGRLTGRNVTSGEPFAPAIPANDEPNLTLAEVTSTTKFSTTKSGDAFAALLNVSFPGSASPSTDAEAEAASQRANATRHCDDCFDGEVCVALAHEEVPICRGPRDREDPTGCAGFCVINKQKCHRLDVDAFRCAEIEHYCLDDEWTCSNALCIPLEKRCDGHMNCYDHSDEYDCVCNLETHFQCGNETSCLPMEKRCDGKIDCWDATDEINCTLACPLESEFTCSNGECILKVRFCDGLADCSDGSDEPHGCQGRCNKHEFTCQNGRCVTKGMKCNGVDDCGDGTDERHCKSRFT